MVPEEDSEEEETPAIRLSMSNFLDQTKIDVQEMSKTGEFAAEFEDLPKYELDAVEEGEESGKKSTPKFDDSIQDTPTSQELLSPKRLAVNRQRDGFARNKRMIVSDTDTGLSFNASSFTGTSQKKGLQHQGSIQMSDGSYQSQMTFGQGEAETGEGSKGGSAGT